MKSGMVAAEAVFARLGGDERASVSAALERSWVWDELYRVRNIRPSFRLGMWAGLAYSAIDTYLLRGRAPWTFHNHADYDQLARADAMPPIRYPRPDGKVSFDRLTSVSFSFTNHEEGQPAHLKLRDPEKAISINYRLYNSPEQRYCPAGVYEIVDDGRGRRGRQAAADQRAELRPLQDLRHQGPGAEHRLGSTRRRRRAKLPEHVTRPRGIAQGADGDDDSCGNRTIDAARRRCRSARCWPRPASGRCRPSPRRRPRRPRASRRPRAAGDLFGNYLAGRHAEQLRDYPAAAPHGSKRRSPPIPTRPSW